MRGKAAPLLHDLFIESSKKIPNPNPSEVSAGRTTVYDTWLYRSADYDHPDYPWKVCEWSLMIALVIMRVLTSFGWNEQDWHIGQRKRLHIFHARRRNSITWLTLYLWCGMISNSKNETKIIVGLILLFLKSLVYWVSSSLRKFLIMMTILTWMTLIRNHSTLCTKRIIYWPILRTKAFFVIVPSLNSGLK